MKIIMHRDSVCMGDDCEAPHEEIFQADTVQQLHELLLQNQYFPLISGNNVVWVLESQKPRTVYSYFTKTGKVFLHVPDKNLKKISPDGIFYLKYYYSPLRWQKEILKQCGNQMVIYREGWEEEYLYCEEIMKQD